MKSKILFIFIMLCLWSLSAFAAVSIPLLNNGMIKALGDFAGSPEGLVFIIGAVVGLLKWLFEHTGIGKYKLMWEKYGGMVVNAFAMAEKAIPDNTDNKTLAKIDSFLKTFTASYQEAYNKPAPDSLLTWAKYQASLLAQQAKAVKSPNS